MRNIRIIAIILALFIISAPARAQSVVGLLGTDNLIHALKGDTSGNIYVLPYLIYNTTPPAPTNGAYVQQQSDTQGNLKVYLASAIAGEDLTNNVMGTINKVVIASTYTPSLDTAFGTAVTHNSKATAGLLMAVTVANFNTAVRYLQIYNSTGSTSGTPVAVFPIPAGSATAPAIQTFGDTFFTRDGVYLSTGITWAISTTQATYTAATASDHNIDVVYY